jgi:hypothetical protein
MKRVPCQARLVIFLLAAVAGCSIREYESRIDEQQKRIAIIDEENRILSGDGIEQPMVTVKENTKAKYWPFEVFLRLPFGSSITPATSYVSNSQEVRLFRYAGPNSCVFLIAAGLAIDPEKDKGKDPVKDAKGKDLGKDGKGKEAKPHEFTVDAFSTQVREAFLDYYRKEYKATPEFPMFDRAKFQRIRKQPIATRGENLLPVDYDAIAMTDSFNKAKDQPARFDVYFCQQSNRQVAIIVQCPLALQNDAQVATGLDWSLKSLASGAEGEMRRQALYNRRR